MKFLISFHPYLTCFKEDGFRVIYREFDSEEREASWGAGSCANSEHSKSQQNNRDGEAWSV